MTNLNWRDREPYVLDATTRQRFLSSEPVAGEWEVSVSLPSGPFAGGGPYPALYLVDPMGTFVTAAAVASVTSMLSMGALPPIAIIGVGPATTDVRQIMVQRNRDLTPSAHTPPAIAGMDGMGTGGGGAFLELLVDHVIPELEGSGLPLDPSERAIGGWSLGGLFACFAMLTRPDAFRRYLAVSPSLWWHDSLLLDEARVVAADLAGRSAYLAVGEFESDHAIDNGWPPATDAMRVAVAGIDMRRDLLSFASLVRTRGDVSVHEDVIAGESHATIWPAAVTRGLVKLWG